MPKTLSSSKRDVVSCVLHFLILFFQMHVEFVLFYYYYYFLIVLVEGHIFFLQNALSDFSFGYFDELWNYIHSFLVF